MAPVLSADERLAQLVRPDIFDQDMRRLRLVNTCVWSALLLGEGEIARLKLLTTAKSFLQRVDWQATPTAPMEAKVYKNAFVAQVIADFSARDIDHLLNSVLARPLPPLSAAHFVSYAETLAHTQKYLQQTGPDVADTEAFTSKTTQESATAKMPPLLSNSRLSDLTQLVNNESVPWDEYCASILGYRTLSANQVDQLVTLLWSDSGISKSPRQFIAATVALLRSSEHRNNAALVEGVCNTIDASIEKLVHEGGASADSVASLVAAAFLELRLLPPLGQKDVVNRKTALSETYGIVERAVVRRCAAGGVTRSSTPSALLYLQLLLSFELRKCSEIVDLCQRLRIRALQWHSMAFAPRVLALLDHLNDDSRLLTVMLAVGAAVKDSIRDLTVSVGRGLLSGELTFAQQCTRVLRRMYASPAAMLAVCLEAVATLLSVSRKGAAAIKSVTSNLFATNAVPLSGHFDAGGDLCNNGLSAESSLLQVAIAKLRSLQPVTLQDYLADVTLDPYPYIFWARHTLNCGGDASIEQHFAADESPLADTLMACCDFTTPQFVFSGSLEPLSCDLTPGTRAVITFVELIEKAHATGCGGGCLHENLTHYDVLQDAAARLLKGLDAKKT